MTEVYLDEQWNQIQPQRAVDATNFSNGSILFQFNVSGLNTVSLKDSYFLIKSTLSRGNGTAHIVTDKIAYAHNWTSALFTNVSVLVSGKEVSACNQYNHLAHTIKMRQMYEENILNTNFRDMMDYDIDFTRRLNRHATDNAVTQREDGMKTQDNKTLINIRNGDNGRYSVYQPVNLGVFSLGHGAICGDIQIMLNPNPNYQTACVESASFCTDAANPGTLGDDLVAVIPGAQNDPFRYKIDINSIVFMACYAKATKPKDPTHTFTIHEYAVQMKPLAEQLEFQVLPSTEQVCVFVQDQAAGTDTRYPCTIFKARQYTQAQAAGWVGLYGKQYTPDENAAYQVTLGAITKPPILLQPQSSLPDAQFQMVRWLMTHQYNIQNKTFFERYNDWLSSPYHCFDFMRDSQDTSGFLTVRSNFTFGAAGATDWAGGVKPSLFVVAKYSKIVQISYSNGYVTDITMQNV